MTGRETLSHPPVILSLMTPEPINPQQQHPLQNGSGNPVTPACHPDGVHITAIPSQAKEPAANNFTNTPNRSTAEVEAYATRLLRSAERLAQHIVKTGDDDRDDIVGIITQRFVENRDHAMDHYTPERFVRAAARQAGITFQRKERVQRSEGVRLQQIVEHTQGGPIGYWQKRRTYVSGYSPVLDGDGVLFDSARDRSVDVENTVVEAEYHRKVAQACLSVLSDRDRALLYLVDAQGIPVADVAEQMGLARETVSRLVNAARRKVRAQHATLFGEWSDEQDRIVS